VYAALQRNQNHTLDKLENVGDFLGQPEYNYPFMLALWASGVIVNNDWLRDTGIMVIASVTTSGLLQTFAKEAVGRSRPGSGRGPFSYKPFAGEVDYHSFPSGHTMLSVATAWILARQVNFLPLKIIFYSMPAITGASRVYVGAHWLSDIVLGSALGIACAESVLRLYPMIKEKNKYSFTLVPSGNGVGMVLKF
jgi:membrane-associated phospholipid phosphatase